MADCVDTKVSKAKNIREHIDKISVLGGILYDYVNQLREKIDRKTKDMDSNKGRLKDLIKLVRDDQRSIQKQHAVLIETKDVLKKCYRIDLDALETAEEL